MNHSLAVGEAPFTTSISAISISETLKADFALLRETPSYLIHDHREYDLRKPDLQKQEQKKTREKSYEKNHEQNLQKAKFTKVSVDRFARYIVCRNYKNLCYELAHLCWAISNSSQNINRNGAHNSAQKNTQRESEHALFDYFYIQEIVTPRAMLEHFESVSKGDCVMPSASLTVTHSATSPDSSTVAGVTVNIHQHRFCIHSNRANLLAVCMEWLVTISPNIFERAHDAVYGKGHNAISQLSSDWQKIIYDYLKEHLPPVKTQSKFQYYRDYLQGLVLQGKSLEGKGLQEKGSQEKGLQEKGLQAKSLERFSDEHILPLWQSLAEREGSERFTTVLKDVCQFHEALDSAKYQQALDYYDDLNDAVINECLHDALERYANEQIPLHELYQSPKLLSKQQAQRLQILCDYPHQSTQLPLSLLREGVLGNLQAKCIQAQRNRTLDSAFISLPEDNLYLDLIIKFKAQVELNEHSFYAVLYILLEHENKHEHEHEHEHEPEPEPEHNAALDLLSSNNRALNEFIMRSDHDSQHVAGITNQQGLIEQILQNEALMLRCKKAYQQNNRQGFTPQTTLDDNQVYLQNTKAMLRISERLIALNARYNTLFPDSSTLLEKYHADGVIFCDELIKRMM